MLLTTTFWILSLVMAGKNWEVFEEYLVFGAKGSKFCSSDCWPAILLLPDVSQHCTFLVIIPRNVFISLDGKMDIFKSVVSLFSSWMPPKYEGFVFCFYFFPLFLFFFIFFFHREHVLWLVMRLFVCLKAQHLKENLEWYEHCCRLDVLLHGCTMAVPCLCFSR